MITDRLESLEIRYQELEDALTEPEVIKNQDLYHKYRKEHADLAPVIQVSAAISRWRKNWRKTRPC